MGIAYMVGVGLRAMTEIMILRINKHSSILTFKIVNNLVQLLINLSLCFFFGRGVQGLWEASIFRCVVIYSTN